jgi:hypothetical protein
MDEQERQCRIAYVEKQFAIRQAYVAYWGAMATTGAAKLRDISQGRKPTPEERERGITLPMRPLTDEEKVADALQTMRRQIELMSEDADILDELRRGEDV